MTSAIHPTRLRILAEIMQANQDQRPAPTMRELCAITQRSATCIVNHLKALKADGLVTWDMNKTGTLRATCRAIGPDALAERNTASRCG